MPKAVSEWIKNVIRTKLEQFNNGFTISDPVEPVLPFLFKNCNISWLDIDPTELARQLTHVQMRLFSVLCFDEFVGQKWTKPEKGEAPNILKSIDRFNKISGWTADYILHLKGPVQRGNILSRLIDTAMECIRIKNYDTVVQILSGIDNAAISRLKSSWGCVSERHLNKLEEMRELFNPQDNWKRYRVELAAAEPPCIPYLGLYLQSLTFSEDGNPDFLPPHNLINWQKYDVIASMLFEIHKYQLAHFAIPPVKEIQDMFELSKFTPPSDKQLYEWSLEVEPRGVDNDQKDKDIR